MSAAAKARRDGARERSPSGAGAELREASLGQAGDVAGEEIGDGLPKPGLLERALGGLSEHSAAAFVITVLRASRPLLAPVTNGYTPRPENPTREEEGRCDARRSAVRR